MKNKILAIFAALSLMGSFSACDDHNYGPDTEENRGTLSFSNFGLTIDESQAVVESSRAASTTPDVNNFLVTIINKATGKPVTGYTSGKKFGDLPGVVDLQAGVYTIKVESHKPLKADWNAPYYIGTKDVEIEEDKITNAESVLCKFNSVRVTIKYSDKLASLLGDDVLVTVSYGDGAYLNFSKSETRSGYFAPVEGATTMIASITGTVNGQKVEEYKSFNNIAPGKHYLITFKVLGPQDPTGETGMINPGEGVSIDTSVVSTDRDGNVTIEEEILNGDDRPGKEDPDPNDPNKPDQPTPPTEDEKIKIESETIDFNEINVIKDGTEYVVKIFAEEGISNLKVKIESPYLTEEFMEGIYFTTEFDLAEPGEYEAKLKGFGFPVGNEVIGATSVDFVLSQLVPMLSLGDPNDHSFILTVIDQKANSITKTLKFRSL